MQVFTIRSRKPGCICGLMEIAVLPVPSMEFMQKLMLYRVMRQPDLRLQQTAVLHLQEWMFRRRFLCIRRGRITFTGDVSIRIFR